MNDMNATGGISSYSRQDSVAVLAINSPPESQRHFRRHRTRLIDKVVDGDLPTEAVSYARLATAFLDIDLPVTLVDRDDAAVERGAAGIRKTIAALVSKARISEAEGEKRADLLTVSTDLPAAVATADLAIEAVFEQIDLKKQVFGQIDAAAKPDAIQASNTSFLDLNLIAEATSRLERVIGLHFFAPANIMRLLEVVRGAKTSDEVIATGMALSRRLGKVAVLSGVCDDFIANRVMRPRMTAAETSCNLHLLRATPVRCAAIHRRRLCQVSTPMRSRLAPDR